ncbi:MAG: putative quinol monooxygenase [Mycetocola sp.]
MSITIPSVSGPVALVGVARPRPERAGELAALLYSFVEPTRAEPGAVAYNLHTADNGDLVFYEHWRSAEDLAAHLALPHMRDFQDRRMDYLVEDLNVRWLTPVEAEPGVPTGPGL